MKRIIMSLLCAALFACGGVKAQKTMKEKNGFTQLEFSDLKRGNANPWGLVYAGAVAENQPGKVNIRTINYLLKGLKIAANVYTPAGYDAGKRYPALVVAHPNGEKPRTISQLSPKKMRKNEYLQEAVQ